MGNPNLHNLGHIKPYFLDDINIKQDVVISKKIKCKYVRIDDLFWSGEGDSSCYMEVETRPNCIVRFFYYFVGVRWEKIKEKNSEI